MGSEILPGVSVVFIRCFESFYVYCVRCFSTSWLTVILVFLYPKYCRAFEENMFNRIFIAVRTSKKLRKLGNGKLRNFYYFSNVNGTVESSGRKYSRNCHVWKVRHACLFSSEILKEKYGFMFLNVYGRIIFKWILTSRLKACGLVESG